MKKHTDHSEAHLTDMRKMLETHMKKHTDHSEAPTPKPVLRDVSERQHAVPRHIPLAADMVPDVIEANRIGEAMNGGVDAAPSTRRQVQVILGGLAVNLDNQKAVYDLRALMFGDGHSTV